MFVILKSDVHQEGNHSGVKQRPEQGSGMSKLIPPIAVCPPSINQTQVQILIPPSSLTLTAQVSSDMLMSLNEIFYMLRWKKMSECIPVSFPHLALAVCPRPVWFRLSFWWERKVPKAMLTLHNRAFCEMLKRECIYNKRKSRRSKAVRRCAGKSGRMFLYSFLCFLMVFLCWWGWYGMARLH